MALEINRKEHEGVTLLDMKGRITVGPEATALREAVASAATDGIHNLVLNLNRRNIELLVMTKLATVFEIFNDEQDAVNSFFPDRKLNQFDILSFVQQMKKEE
jgi:anti-sigma B factor antagonist